MVIAWPFERLFIIKIEYGSPLDKLADERASTGTIAGFSRYLRTALAPERMWQGHMPIFRYFVAVSSCLLALLFVAARCLPEPAERVAVSDVDKSIIKIHSARVGPEKIEFDTAHPPRVTQVAETDRPEPRARRSFAMMPEPGPSQARSAQPAVVSQDGHRHVARLHQKTRKRAPESLIAFNRSQPVGW